MPCELKRVKTLSRLVKRIRMEGVSSNSIGSFSGFWVVQIFSRSPCGGAAGGVRVWRAGQREVGRSCTQRRRLWRGVAAAATEPRQRSRGEAARTSRLANVPPCLRLVNLGLPFAGLAT